MQGMTLPSGETVLVNGAIAIALILKTAGALIVWRMRKIIRLIWIMILNN